MPFTDAGTFDEQVLQAIDLVRAERYVSAAAVLSQLRNVDRSHLSAALTELERGHAHNAIVAIELIHAVYRRPRLLS